MSADVEPKVAHSKLKFKNQILQIFKTDRECASHGTQQNNDHFNIKCVAVSDDGRKLICGASDGKVRMWDTNDFGSANETVLTGNDDEVTSVSMSGNRKRVVSPSEDKTVRVCCETLLD